MGLIGGPYSTERQQSGWRQGWTTDGQREYLFYFTPDCDDTYVKNNVGYSLCMQHPTDNRLFITSFSVETDGTPVKFPAALDTTGNLTGTDCLAWRMAVEYGGFNGYEDTPDGNPINQKPAVSFHWEIFEQPVDIAIVGKNSDGSYKFAPVVNSVGLPYDPPVIRDALRGMIEIQYNLLTFNPYQVGQYGNYINNDQWNSFPPYSLKLTPPSVIDTPFSQYLGVNYYRLQAQIAFNPDPNGWNATPIDRSFMRLDSNGNRVKILDVYGKDYDSPSLLDGSGNPLPIGSTSYYQFNYQVYYDIAFASSLPPNFQNLFF